MFISTQFSDQLEEEKKNVLRYKDKLFEFINQLEQQSKMNKRDSQASKASFGSKFSGGSDEKGDS